MGVGEAGRSTGQEAARTATMTDQEAGAGADGRCLKDRSSHALGLSSILRQPTRCIKRSNNVDSPAG